PPARVSAFISPPRVPIEATMRHSTRPAIEPFAGWPDGLADRGFIEVPKMLLQDLTSFGLSPTNLAVWLSLESYARDPSVVDWPAALVLSDGLGLGESTFRAHVALLEAVGFIERIAMVDLDGRQVTNDYATEGLFELAGGLDSGWIAAPDLLAREPTSIG